MSEYTGADARHVTDGVFQDGVVDVYERIAGIHDGRPQATKVDSQVELTSYEDIVAVTKRRDVHSMDPDTAAVLTVALGAGRPLIPLMLDGDEHTKYRKLLDPLFAPRQVAKLEEVIRTLANSLIDTFAGRGQVEFYEAFCVPLPSQIFLTQLGLPLDDLPFLLWVKDGIIRPSDDEHRTTASPRLVDYLYAELDRREADTQPRDDLIAGFLEAEVD